VSTANTQQSSHTTQVQSKDDAKLSVEAAKLSTEFVAEVVIIIIIDDGDDEIETFSVILECINYVIIDVCTVFAVIRWKGHC